MLNLCYDILIYIDGSRIEYQKQIKKGLKRLRKTGLQLNVNKYEFEMKTTKYLGFIIKINKSIIMDPAKTEIIIKWEAFKTVKGVQMFLGFINFYRKIIKENSQLVMCYDPNLNKEGLPRNVCQSLSLAVWANVQKRSESSARLER